MIALTKTERLVLSALRFAEKVELDNTRADFPDTKVTGVAFMLSSVVRDTNLCRVGGPRISERRIYDALQSLDRRGLVKKDTATGMGGGFTTYVLTTEGRS
jgi:hypothetical protein